MANTHSFINTTRCVCWDVDAFNACGIGEVDFDNGQFVTRGAMALNAATGGYDHDPGALGKQSSDEPEEKGFLPVLCNHDGAMGRTGFHSFLRWRYDGCSA